MRMMVLASFTFAILGCQAVHDDSSVKVLYGEDGRLEVYEVQPTGDLKDRVQSTAALFESKNVEASANAFRLAGKPIDKLCAGERFRAQPSASFCSGVLVAPDILLTAGHCVAAVPCESIRVVFSYELDAPDRDPLHVDPGDVYQCAEVLAQNHNFSGDYAAIRLDRIVSNRRPVPLRKSGEPAAGTPLTLVGHPVGWPKKIAVGGKIRGAYGPAMLLASLDAYGGNSGSPVFNSETLELEGLEVNGETDFSQEGGCLASKKCPDDGCLGEKLTRATILTAFSSDLSALSTGASVKNPLTGNAVAKRVETVLRENSIPSCQWELVSSDDDVRAIRVGTFYGHLLRAEWTENEILESLKGYAYTADCFN